jgi:hypothetical protein
MLAEQLHHMLLAELHAADALNWTPACVDASHIRAKKRGRGHRPVTGRPREDRQ